MKTDLCPRVTTPPLVAVLEQAFARPREPDVRSAVFREMHKLFPDTAPLLDKVVGLTMPSRGIRDIQTLVRAAVEAFARSSPVARFAFSCSPWRWRQRWLLPITRCQRPRRQPPRN